MFEHLAEKADNEYARMDSTIVRAHQHSAGAPKKGLPSDRTQQGRAEHVHTTVDALGNPTGFPLTPGQACDLDGADVLLLRLQSDTLLADKGYDADERVLLKLGQAGKTAVVPAKTKRKRHHDKDMYKARHLIENFFAKLKQFRAIATRFDKTARNFLVAIYFVSAVVWLDG